MKTISIPQWVAAVAMTVLSSFTAFAQVTNLNLGNLAPGETITVTFEVTINNSLPPTVQGITNQAAVSGTGFTTVNSDDPKTGALNDPTVTPLVQAPTVVTLPAAAIGADFATLPGLVNPGGDSTGYYVEYGTNISFPTRSVTNVLAASYVTNLVGPAVGFLRPNTVYQYRMVATNSVGLVTGSTLSFTTTVFSVTAQPVNSSACVGGTASFTVGVNAPGAAAYQWQRRAPGAGVFNNILNATNALYTTPPVFPPDDGAGYRVLVSAPGTNLISSEVLLAVISITSTNATYDFNSGLPANTAVYGSAVVTNGVLSLTTNGGGLQGGFLTADLAPGRVVRGFAATFKLRIAEGSGQPADGFSFNWANNLPNDSTGEEGAGSGLTVSFDTYDNGAGEAPAIDVKWNSNVVAHTAVPLNFITDFSGSFRTALIRLNSDGTLDMTYNCQPVLTRFPIPGYAPQLGGRFLLGARTGGEFAAHSVDDFAVQLDVDPTNGVPRITSIVTQAPAGIVIRGTAGPFQSLSLEGSQDFTNWIWRATVRVLGGGGWSFFEPDISTPPYRFYRAKAAAQFPDGLMNWWRADGNFLDSFGALPGTPTNGLVFTNGQRGSAFDFNGTNQSLRLGGTPVTVPWTACFWVRRTNANDVSAALISDANTALKLEQALSTRRVGFTQFGGTDFIFNTITPTNTWVHLGFVAAPGGTILYVNGSAAETNANTVNLPRLTLGASFGGTGDRLKGQLDEVTLFNRALTPAEIQQVLNVTRGP